MINLNDQIIRPSKRFFLEKYSAAFCVQTLLWPCTNELKLKSKAKQSAKQNQSKALLGLNGWLWLWPRNAYNLSKMIQKSNFCRSLDCRKIQLMSSYFNCFCSYSFVHQTFTINILCIFKQTFIFIIKMYFVDAKICQ